MYIYIYRQRESGRERESNIVPDSEAQHLFPDLHSETLWHCHVPLYSQVHFVIWFIAAFTFTDMLVSPTGAIGSLAGRT